MVVFIGHSGSTGREGYRRVMVPVQLERPDNDRNFAASHLALCPIYCARNYMRQNLVCADSLTVYGRLVQIAGLGEQILNQIAPSRVIVNYGTISKRQRAT